MIEVYERYIQILKDQNAIDSVLLIRKAIAECSVIDAEFIKLKEYEPNPLETALLQKVSGGKVGSPISINSLFNVDGKQIKISGFKNCYGASNEVETILSDIYSGKNTDECTVAVTDPATYGQLFFDYALMYDIPMTFGCGIPIMNSNPAKLLNLYYNWMTNGFFGSEAILTMIHSDAFDKSKLTSLLPEPGEGFSWSSFYEILGQIRFTNNLETNKDRLERYKKALSEDEVIIDKNDTKACKQLSRAKSSIPFLEVMAKELAMDTIDFISKYSYIRIGDTSNARSLLMKLDFQALNEIKEQMLLIDSVDIEMTKEDVILSILKNNVLVQHSDPGKIHITSINKAITFIRKNMFIVGLSATKYPGSPKENYLLLDEDLRLFGESSERYTSAGNIENKKNRLLELVRLSSMLGSSVYVSYSGLNVSELKGENASSLIYELFKEEHGRNVTSDQLNEQIKKVEYFDPGLSLSRFIGKEYVNGSFIIKHKHNREMRWPEQTFEKEYSPSALETYMGCPRSFFLKYIIGLSVPDDDDPFEIISARAEGTLAHSLMELLAEEPNMSVDAFKAKAEEYFDRYIDEHPPLISKNVEYKRTQFIEMMESAYNTDPKPHREVVLKEEDIHCEHEVGIKIHGFR
ncbi:MAG: PD-(D/E)XK nuclease family protein [Clostridiales bacterium]|nr:PD-(D/E)XK nuclease family protein [Clostridiales bacterium]